MSKKNKKLVQCLISIGVISLYFFHNVFLSILLSFLNINYDQMNNIAKTIFLLVAEIITVLIIAYPYRKEIKTGIIDFIENNKIYFKKYFKYWLLLMAIMMLSNYAINLLKGGVSTSVNEQQIRDEFLKNPIYIYVSAVFIAPIVEELIFRRSIRSFFKNNTIFIIVSGLVFGAMHLATGLESPIDYLYIISYASPGIIFAYLYVKTNNIMVPMSMHIMHNGIQMSIQTITMLFL